jgi:hypothetical protein
MSNIQSIVDDFANQLSALIEAQVIARARATVAAALGAQGKRGPGRPPKLAKLVELSIPGAVVNGRRKPRKKAPPQLCPVPGCKNRAAPIFGMVCSEHQDVPKAKIKQYREARRAEKGKVKAKGRVAKPNRAARPKRVAKPKPAPTPAEK